MQVVTGESGTDEDRERDQLLRRATELRGSITHAQDRYGAILDVFKTNEDITLGTLPAPQVCCSRLDDMMLFESSTVQAMCPAEKPKSM